MSASWWDARSGLAGSVAAVTGGAGGLGEAIARDLVANGVQVAVIDIDPASVARMSEEFGSEILIEAGDVREPDRLEAFFSIPMRRPGALTDVSGCVVFLASALSAFVTGQTLHPDGGAYASSGWFNWPGTGWSNGVPTDVQKLIADRLD
jgi:3-oxoacyl-[acyl-carrier protein] reductase